MNSRKPGGKGQPAVSGKSPHLTGFGRGAGVVAQDQQDEENDGPSDKWTAESAPAIQ